ncbi:MAG: hypothetical protein JRI55_23980 [Deltaproteobacteria bacterium]|nr:hypothetical protein [Deltaproteobacteria bacterium]
MVGAVDHKLLLDGGPPCLTGCNVTTKINYCAKSCASQCVSTSNDPDCDGLPDPRDPDPGCNRFVIAEELAADPASNPGVWSVTGAPKWSCGTESFQDGDRLELDATLAPATSRFLAEMEFTLGPLNTAVGSTVILSAGVPGKADFECRARTEASNPGLQLVANNGACTYSNKKVIPSGEYVMQLYVDSSDTMTCRLYDGQGNLFDTAQRPVSMCPASAATFEVSLRSVTQPFIAHNIRVFELP